MKLSDELAVEFAKITNDTDKDKSPTTVNATIVEYDGKKYARLDGAEEGMLTPIENTTEVNADDRVVGTIRNHTLTVTGNATDPSAGSKLMKDTVTGATSEFKQTANGFMFEVTDAANNAKSTIEQTASSLKTEIQNTATNEKSAITQTANEVKSEISNSLGEWTEFKQTVEGFAFMDKGGTVKISGGDIELTGSISFSDLDSSTQTKVNNASYNASTAYTLAQGAVTTANEAKQIAQNASGGANVTLPDYIEDAYIDGAEIRSPKIIGGDFYAVGTSDYNPGTFTRVATDGLYIYYEEEPVNTDGTLDYKAGIICSDSGKYVQLVLGAGSSSSSQYSNYNRFFINKFSMKTELFYTDDYGTQCGFRFKDSGNIEVIGTLNIFPVGTIIFTSKNVSPASQLGGTWARTNSYIPITTTDPNKLGDNVYLAGGPNASDGSYRATFIMAWERVS